MTPRLALTRVASGWYWTEGLERATLRMVALNDSLMAPCVARSRRASHSWPSPLRSASSILLYEDSAACSATRAAASGAAGAACGRRRKQIAVETAAEIPVIKRLYPETVRPLAEATPTAIQFDITREASIRAGS